MAKQHLKAINAPKTWDITRKDRVFVTRPLPGSHTLDLGLSITHILIKELKLASTSYEVKYLIRNKECLLNGKPLDETNKMAGFMDVLTFPKIKKIYRVSLSLKGKLKLLEISEKEANLYITKVAKKTIVPGGKMQLNLYDGRNIITKENYQTSEGILMEVPSGHIKKRIPLAEKSIVMLIGGKHIGVTGIIEKIEGNNVFFKSDVDKHTYQTSKKYVFVLGKEKSELTVK